MGRSKNPEAEKVSFPGDSLAVDSAAVDPFLLCSDYSTLPEVRSTLEAALLRVTVFTVQPSVGQLQADVNRETEAASCN